MTEEKKNKKTSDRVFMVDDKSIYVHNVKKLWKKSWRYIFSGVIAIVVLTAVCAVLNMKNYALGYELIVDGQVVGYIDDTNVMEQAEAEVRKAVKTFVGEAEEYDKNPEYVRRLVNRDECLKKEEIVDYLLENLEYVVPSYGIYINDKFVAAVTSEKVAEKVLEEYLIRYAGVEITDDTVLETKEKYTYKLDYEKGINNLVSLEEAISILAGTDKEQTKYTVVAGDTLSEIAERYGMASSVEIVAMNPELANGGTIRAGDEIIVEKAVPKLSVIASKTMEYEEETPFETETQEDATAFKGESTVISKGIPGKVRTVANVVTENGIEIKREVISTEVLSEPVTEIKKVGTKVPPQFINPASGVLSSPFGSRWGRNHNGIDVAGSYGSTIKAAAAGTVTYSGWMSGYGNYVVIDHGNGYTTAYGHNASNSVSKGQSVSQGQEIAKMGSTGRSTGTHVHFEIKKSGAFQNPLNYVSY